METGTQTQSSHHYRGSGTFQSPVDDQMYDLLQALVSKCEAIEAYAKYEEDSDEQGRQLFQSLAQQDVQAAEQLLDALRTRLSGSGGSSSQ